jgi:hypothetical protein
MLHALETFRLISIQCKISRDQLFAITFFWNTFSQPDPLRLIACISKESDRKMSIARHFALNENQPLWCACAYKFWYNWPETYLISTYLLKNSYYVKIRKLKILTRIGNVFMSDCSSAVARDGNNKVNCSRSESRFYHWLTIRSKGRTIRKVMGGGKFFMFAFFSRLSAVYVCFFLKYVSRILNKSDACICFQTLFVCMDFFSVFSPPSPSLF